MKSNDWNPELYLKFNKERIQPSMDLVSRITIEEPKSIVDIGCGPGNSTQILRFKWPNSDILGVDKSEAMISKAATDFPDQEWKILDANTENFPDSYDIVYSNATIQWIPNHEQLLNKLSEIVKPQGALAIQVPLFFDMPLGQSIVNIAQNSKWSHLTGEAHQAFTILKSTDYYDILSTLFSRIEIWETDYVHIMDSHSSILEMIKSTGLRPYTERIEDEHLLNQFQEMVLNSIESDYPIQRNSKVLFPFKRLFFIGYK